LDLSVVIVPVEYPVLFPSSISIGKGACGIDSKQKAIAPLTTLVVALVVYDPSIEAAPREAGLGPDLLTNMNTSMSSDETYFFLYLDDSLLAGF